MESSKYRLPPVAGWEGIAEEFLGSDLLLGNGLSISVWPDFAYESLFENFLSGLTAGDQAAFRTFDTTNFEFILESIYRAIHVNDAFGIDADPLRVKGATLQEGLIRSVEAVHPRATALNWGRIEALSQQLDLFGDVFTTNYDCLLYHVIMMSRDRHESDDRVRPYNDYFWKTWDDDYLEFQDYQNYAKYKHIYYLHGAVFLFRKWYTDLKVRRSGGAELIDRVALAVRGGQVPLFISEASAEDKRQAIYRSEYLNFALRTLRERRDSLVSFGFSWADVDDHIATAVKAGTRRVAVSLFRGSRTDQEIEAEKERIFAKLMGCDVTFFWSDGLF